MHDDSCNLDGTLEGTKTVESQGFSYVKHKSNDLVEDKVYTYQLFDHLYDIK